MCATINHKQNQSNDKNVTNFRNTPLKQTINIPEPRSIQWDPFLNDQVRQMSYFRPIKHGSDTSLSTWWSCPKELFDQNSTYLTIKVYDAVSKIRFEKEKKNDLMPEPTTTRYHPLWLIGPHGFFLERSLTRLVPSLFICTKVFLQT